MVPALWCSWSSPPVLVWRFSFLLCCASFIWSRWLDATVSAVTMSLVIFSGFMTALYLDTVLDHEIGVVTAHLNSHFAAAMLGYALAKHCQHNGLEVTAATATPPKQLSEEKQKEASVLLFLGKGYIGMVTILGTAAMAWVVFHRAEQPTEYLIIFAFGPMAFVLLFWSIALGVVLRGVYIGEGRFTLLGGQLIVVELLFLWGFVALGDVGAMVGTWIGFLICTGCFGYSLRVYNSLKDEEPFSLIWTSRYLEARKTAVQED